MIYGYDAVYFKGQPLDALYRGTEKIYPDGEYFFIHNLEDSDGTFQLKLEAYKTMPPLSFQCSTDSGETWRPYSFFYQGKIPIPANGTLIIDGAANQGHWNVSNSEWCYIDVNVDFEIYGSLSALGGDPVSSAVTTNSEYMYLFLGNTHLINASHLKMHSVVKDSCYAHMFRGCINLNSIPSLPALVVESSAYRYMFQGCSSLTNVPNLPATKIYGGSYAQMFDSCISLQKAPEIAVTEIMEANSCNYMFNGCTAMTAGPSILPATDLYVICYVGMFMGCSSMTVAPILPAQIVKNQCYEDMFNGCSSLQSITCLATDISANRALDRWVTGVANSGTFICDPTMVNSWPTGNNGCPSTWTIQPYN